MPSFKSNPREDKQGNRARDTYTHTHTDTILEREDRIKRTSSEKREREKERGKDIIEKIGKSNR